MAQRYRYLILGLLALVVFAGGLAGCSDNSAGEPPGKHDTPELKERRKDKKGD